MDENNVFIGTGRWKIRKPNTGDRVQVKSLPEIQEVIYRPDGSFCSY